MRPHSVPFSSSTGQPRPLAGSHSSLPSRRTPHTAARPAVPSARRAPPPHHLPAPSALCHRRCRGPAAGSQTPAPPPRLGCRGGSPRTTRCPGRSPGSGRRLGAIRRRRLWSPPPAHSAAYLSPIASYPARDTEVRAPDRAQAAQEVRGMILLGRPSRVPANQVAAPAGQ
jgi:hypothetical protein